MKKKALVIEDNESNLLLEKDLLEAAGFEVFESENAKAGIAIAKGGKPDIIIMDVRLPDMSGIEAARILQADKGTCEIPIVFVTASLLTESKASINAVTKSGLIGKPINTRTFAKEVSKFIKGVAITQY